MKQYKINKGFIVQKLGEKTVIFDGEESVLYTFNETASFIFQKLKLGLEKEEIVKRIAKRFNVQEVRARKDFDELIKDLLNKKIIAQKTE